MGDLGEAVGPAAGFSNLRSLRHSSAALADPLRPSQHPALVQARRARWERPEPPRERPGNPLENSRCANGCSLLETRPTHDEVKQQRRGLGAFFEANPGRVLGDFVLKYGP
jgi:hypothetical protein